MIKDSEKHEDNSVEEAKLYKVIGENCRRAREISNLSMKEAQSRIWGYKNKEMNANRISELENGRKKIDAKTLYAISRTYGVSIDYLFGLSDDFENNLASSHCGMIFNSVRDVVLESTDRICMEMARTMRILPPFQGEMLKDTSKKLVGLIYEAQMDLSFKGKYGEIIDCASELMIKVREFEQVFARQMRILESTMIEQINRVDNETAPCVLSDREEIPNSQKC